MAERRQIIKRNRRKWLRQAGLIVGLLGGGLATFTIWAGYFAAGIVTISLTAGILAWVLLPGKRVTTPRRVTIWKPILFVTLNSLLFLALLGSLISYVIVYNGEDPLALLGMYILFFPAFFIVGIALLILGKFFHVSTLNKLLPFIAVLGLFLPLGNITSDANLLAGISIAAVLCAFVIATTVKNLISQRGKVGNGNA